MSSKKKKRIWTAVILVLALVAAGIYVYLDEQKAETLPIENGKLKGVSSAWLIGRLPGEERYVKLADVGFLPDYKTPIKGAEDPDGDSLTNFYAFEAVDPGRIPGSRKTEKKPGQTWVFSAGGSREEAARNAGFSSGEEAVINGKTGYLASRTEDGQVIDGFFIDSPYRGISIAMLAIMPESEAPGEARALLEGLAAQVKPGKKTSELVRQVQQNFIDDNRWTFLTRGLGKTMEITLCAVLMGIILGSLVAVVRSTWDQNAENMRPGFGKSVLGVLNGFCKVYLTVIRGTPVLVQLMIIYFVIFAGSREGTPFAILGFGINSGAYVAEIIRGGIASVDRGQLEAGRSLGFNYVQTMWYIIIPQALKSVLPALANEFIVLLKETSVAGTVAVMDLNEGGSRIRGITQSPFMPLIAVALIYLILVMFFTWLVGKLERRLRSSDH